MHRVVSSSGEDVLVFRLALDGDESADECSSFCMLPVPDPTNNLCTIGNFLTITGSMCCRICVQSSQGSRHHQHSCARKGQRCGCHAEEGSCKFCPLNLCQTSVSRTLHPCMAGMYRPTVLPDVAGPLRRTSS